MKPVLHPLSLTTTHTSPTTSWRKSVRSILGIHNGVLAIRTSQGRGAAQTGSEWNSPCLQWIAVVFLDLKENTRNAKKNETEKRRKSEEKSEEKSCDPIYAKPIKNLTLSWKKKSEEKAKKKKGKSPATPSTPNPLRTWHFHGTFRHHLAFSGPWFCMMILDGRNRAIVIWESLARVIVAIRIASVRWRSYLFLLGCLITGGGAQKARLNKWFWKVHPYNDRLRWAKSRDYQLSQNR